MSELMGLDNSREVIKRKLRQTFDGRIVRKDLTKHSKGERLLRRRNGWILCSRMGISQKSSSKKS